MPFTFSHPAIVLPLAYLPKRWISLTGLIIGSMTPDFEYFIRMNVKSIYSHSLPGVFWFNLPLGILLTFLFHSAVRDTLFENLPRFFKHRLLTFTDFDWRQYFKRNWLVVSISVVIGAASHIFWDGFTHQHGYFVNLISGLTNEVEILGERIPLYRILQHLSTLVGGLIIIYAIINLPSDQNVGNDLNFRYWIIFMILTTLIIMIRFAVGVNMKNYGLIIVIGISAGFISLILTPLLLKIATKTW